MHVKLVTSTEAKSHVISICHLDTLVLWLFGPLVLTPL